MKHLIPKPVKEFESELEKSDLEDVNANKLYACIYQTVVTVRPVKLKCGVQFFFSAREKCLSTKFDVTMKPQMYEMLVLITTNCLSECKCYY